MDVMAGLTKKRGKAGVDRLMADILAMEPYLVLSLPTRELRRAYAARTEARRGRQARIDLEAAVKAIWESRKQPPAEPAPETE